jgi:hypothetical protein
MKSTLCAARLATVLGLATVGCTATIHVSAEPPPPDPQADAGSLDDADPAVPPVPATPVEDAAGPVTGGGGPAPGSTAPGSAAPADAARPVVGPGACVGGSIPADVQGVLKARCQLCHGNPPLAPVPTSLTSADDFVRPAKSDPSRNVAAVMIARITSADPTKRMPPIPAAPLTAAETQILQAWVTAGAPLVGCVPTPVATPGAPAPVDAGAPRLPPLPDPFAVAPKCTSGRRFTPANENEDKGGGEGGDNGKGRGGRGDGEGGGEGAVGSPLMEPGAACIACHRQVEAAPRYTLAGTVYPSAHEPTRCFGADGTGGAQGAQVVVVDAAGKTFTLGINAAGNFFQSAAVTPPLRAKVVFMGRERVMIGMVPTGDCNSCHTQAGTTVVTAAGALKAPGRIILP